MNKALFIVPLILLSLLTSIWAGWLRLGWSLPVSIATAQHGALMTCSFLASLIFLERAVTFKNKSILLLPAINALSVLFLYCNSPLWHNGVCSQVALGLSLCAVTLFINTGSCIIQFSWQVLFVFLQAPLYYT